MRSLSPPLRRLVYIDIKYRDTRADETSLFQSNPALMKAHTNWTADDIPDLTGRNVIVTGANSGVGFESAIEFARHGSRTVIACRSHTRGEKALDRVKREVPNANVELMMLDLGDLGSIERFVGEFSQAHEQLHSLINNAGIMATPFRKTASGFESQFGTNHLGHFALTAKLMPLLLAAPSSRVVNVSSLAHRGERIDFDALRFERNGYNRWRAYGRSKLANLLFTYELHRRLQNAGLRHVESVAAHPGVSKTNIAQGLGLIGKIAIADRRSVFAERPYGSVADTSSGGGSER